MSKLQLTLRGKSTTQSYRAPVYYVDLTLRDGVQLHEAIQTAQEIKQQLQQSGFQQVALDQIARQGFVNAKFEVNSEEGLEVGEEFYGDEKQQQVHDVSQVQDIQKGLQQSVKAVH